MADRFVRNMFFGLVAVATVSAVLFAGILLLGGGTPVPATGTQHPRGGEAAPFFEDLLKVYTPRGHCMHHEAPVIWLHLVSDFLIGISYFSIPIALVYFVRRRRDIAFNWIFWMFAAFILACGTTHFIGVWDLWQPLYRIDGLVKLGTAGISMATAIMLWPLIPKALAIPSPAQLEQRVETRTRQLAEANRALEEEAEARRQAEAEREVLIESERAARSQAERANRMKDEFLATLSHELRTPIHAILGWAEILATAGSPARLQEGLAVITRNARAQTKLIEDLLDMHRIVSGRLALDLRAVDLAEVIRAAVESVTPAAEGKQIRVQTVLDDRAGMVTGDAGRLQQVMWNLLSNAVKFTPKGGRVEVSLERVDSHVQITVHDNGEGIDPDFLPHLFERFRQAELSTTRHHAGMGLGLAIVRHIVELHGGTVRAHSSGRGKGATFHVTLPVRASMATLQADDAPRRAADRSRSLQGVKVVAIDDDADARAVVVEILGGAGAQVFTAAAAGEGLRCLREHRPDVLLCDIGLPGEDGYALIRRVRQLSADDGGRVPAVAVTAFARSEDRTRALEAGFQAHVAKPFPADELIATIRGLVGLFGDPRSGAT